MSEQFEREAKQAQKLLHSLHPQEAGVFLRLLDGYGSAIRTALHAAYEIGYQDGGNSRAGSKA